MLTKDVSLDLRCEKKTPIQITVATILHGNMREIIRKIDVDLLCDVHGDLDQITRHSKTETDERCELTGETTDA